MQTHTHNWQPSGRVIHSTDRETIGLYHFECDCGSDLYAERMEPAGRMFVREGVRRYRNSLEKVRRGR